MQKASSQKRPLFAITFRRYFPFVTAYVNQCKDTFRQNGMPLRRLVNMAVKYYRPWRATQSRQVIEGPLTDRIPWITFAARDFLEEKIHRNMTVFEYGTGGSTLFFADRVKKVISVENDAAWAGSMFRILKNEYNNNVDLRVVAGKMLAENSTAYPDDPEYCHSGSKDYGRMDFRSYVSVIEEFPDQAFDVVLIDGRSRAACLQRAIAKVCPGGIIVLDNSERSYYTRNLPAILQDWERHVFYGPVPYVEHFFETTCWIRPAAEDTQCV